MTSRGLARGSTPTWTTRGAYSAIADRERALLSEIERIKNSGDGSAEAAAEPAAPARFCHVDSHKKIISLKNYSGDTIDLSDYRLISDMSSVNLGPRRLWPGEILTVHLGPTVNALNRDDIVWDGVLLKPSIGTIKLLRRGVPVDSLDGTRFETPSALGKRQREETDDVGGRVRKRFASLNRKQGYTEYLQRYDDIRSAIRQRLSSYDDLRDELKDVTGRLQDVESERSDLRNKIESLVSKSKSTPISAESTPQVTYVSPSSRKEAEAANQS